MREHIDLLYILQKGVEKGIVYFFLTDYIQSSFVFNIGVPTEYLDFFDLCNIRISVFYMRAQTEFVYILQKRVEKGIVYIFSRSILREILFLTFGCLDNIYIFFYSLKYRISVFYMREHIELMYVLQIRVE